MKWDTYNTRTINEKYVYRYVTIEKLIDFLSTNSIYLSRLDTFEDNLENIEPYDINTLKILYLNKPEDANTDIPEITWEEWIKNDRKRFKELQEYLCIEEIEKMLSVDLQ